MNRNPSPVRITNGLDVSADFGCLGWLIAVAAIVFITTAGQVSQTIDAWKNGTLPPIPIVIVTPLPAATAVPTCDWEQTPDGCVDPVADDTPTTEAPR